MRPLRAEVGEELGGKIGKAEMDMEIIEKDLEMDIKEMEEKEEKEKEKYNSDEI